MQVSYLAFVSVGTANSHLAGTKISVNAADVTAAIDEGESEGRTNRLQIMFSLSRVRVHHLNLALVCWSVLIHTVSTIVYHALFVLLNVSVILL